MVAHQYKIRRKKTLNEKLSFNVNDVSLKNTIIKQIDKPTAQKIIIEYEWLGTMPLFSRYYFGIYFIINNVEYLGGVIVYSDEYSANKTTIWDKYKFTNKLILLSRGVCLWWTPKNTASYFISKTYNWLKTNTTYKIITATVDPSAGEIGTIYQSLNWYYVGLMSGNYINKKESKRFSVLINGKLRYSRSIRKEFGTMKKNIILAKYPNAIFIPQYRKRRYFHFIDNKKMNILYKKQIEHLLLPYPKRNINEAGIIYKITNNINHKIYIGQTTRPFKDRINEYKNNVGCNNYLIGSFNKYGFENFKFEIIDTAKNIEELNTKEIYYINKYKSNNRNIGYNIELGGKNSLTTLETRKKLSLARKNIKQTREWINKRVSKLEKKVVKINLSDNTIICKYKSLAYAGIHNVDNLSYSQILRMCLGKVNYVYDFTYSYLIDYKNNSVPEYVSQKNKSIKFNELEKSVLNEIYFKHINNAVSIRSLSKKHNVNFSKLLDYIMLRKNNVNLKYKTNSIAICKKTKLEFIDYKNKSGVLTRHLIKTYPNIIIKSNFIRKKIEKETGKFWYDNYFNFIQNINI